MNMYTLITDHWTGKLAEWAPGIKPAIIWTTDSAEEAITKLAYFRFAYPTSNFHLQCDGWIVSTEELADLAHFILNPTNWHI